MKTLGIELRHDARTLIISPGLDFSFFIPQLTGWLHLRLVSLGVAKWPRLLGSYLTSIPRLFLIGSNWPALGHMPTSEPITVAMRMRFILLPELSLLPLWVESTPPESHKLEGK